MIEFVSAEEEAFQMKPREEMIDLGGPLGHAVVICVFRPEGKLKPTSGDGTKRPSRCSAQATVGSDSPESCVPIGDQPGTIIPFLKDIGLCDSGIGRAESGLDKDIVQVRRSEGKLGLLQSEEAIVVPWGLPES